jgi:hypothetical protein
MCSDDELQAMSGPALLDRTRDIVEAINRAQAELARTVRVADSKRAFAADGMTTAQSWLRGHCRLSGGAASQVVRNGRVLEQLPAAAEAHASGRITADQVAVIGRITEPRYVGLIEEQNGDLAGVTGVLTDFAATERHDDLVKLVHTFCDRLDADGPEPDPTDQRRLTYDKRADGRVFFRGELDALGGEKFLASLEAHVQADRPAGDTRSRSQQLADALVQWADNTLATGQAPTLRTVKPHVAVQVPLEDLLDPSTGKAAAETGFGAIISAARARWAACDADITRIVLDPDGVPLDHGRTQRLVTSQLRKAVELRDKACVFAACGAPHHWCEVHHVIHWLHGGETNLDNSALLCERHHTQVHHGFRVGRDSSGRWRTYRPDGTEILTVRPALSDDELSLVG